MKQAIWILLFISFKSVCLGQSAGITSIPSFPVINENGDSLDVKELVKGKIAILNFWFIPCPPCMREMGALNDLYNRFSRNNNFSFISITASNPEAVKNLVTESYGDSSMYPFFKMAARVNKIEFPIFYLVTCRDSVYRSGPRIIDFKVLHPEKINCPTEVFEFQLFPTTFITNTKGEIIYRHAGLLNEQDRSLNKVRKILKEELEKLE